MACLMPANGWLAGNGYAMHAAWDVRGEYGTASSTALKRKFVVDVMGVKKKRGGKRHWQLEVLVSYS